MWGGDCRFTALTGAFGAGEQGPVNQPPHPEWEEFARRLLDDDGRPYATMGTSVTAPAPPCSKAPLLHCPGTFAGGCK